MTNITNRIVAKYSLYGAGNSDTDTVIIAGNYRESETLIEIEPRALGINLQDTYLDVKYRGNSDVAIEIQPYGFDQMETEIEIRPHNKMRAIYEVQQPPTVNIINKPVMDAFTRSEGVYATINNGSGTSMVVGKQNGEVWDSYIKFDLSHIDDSLFFLDAKLRLYYTGASPSLNIEVHEINEVWEEYGITHLNAPTTFRLLSDKYTVNPLNRYIEIDVYDIALEWIKNPNMNLGFYLRVSDSSPDGQMIFRTRESVQPPELIVTHYSTSVFSNGRSDIVTEIIVVKSNASEHDTEIEVDSTFSFDIHETEIYCHRPEVPLDSDIELEITITKPYVHAILTVSPIEEDDVETEISVYSNVFIDGCNVEITATKPMVFIEIYSANLSDYETEISVTHKTRPTEITVSNPKVLTEIEVYAKYTNDIETELTVNVVNGDKISDIETEINISHLSRAVEITPRVIGEHQVYTEITSSNPYILVEIRTPEQSNMETVIDVISQSSVLTEIAVTNDKIYVEIDIVSYGESNADAEIYIKWVNFLPIEITSRSVSQVDTEIDIRITSNVDVIITVSNDRMYAEITPRPQGESNVFAVLEPRMSTVDNIDTIIYVGGRRGAYGFVM